MEKGNGAGIAGAATGAAESVGFVERTTTVVAGIGEEVGSHVGGKALDRAAEAVLDRAHGHLKRDGDSAAAPEGQAGPDAQQP